MTQEQLFSLINAGFTKQDIMAMFGQDPTQQVQQVQQVPAQAQQVPAQAQQVQQVQQVPVQQVPVQQVPAVAGSPVNQAPIVGKMLDIVQELQRENLRLATGGASAQAETPEDILLGALGQIDKGGTK